MNYISYKIYLYIYYIYKLYIITFLFLWGYFFLLRLLLKLFSWQLWNIRFYLCIESWLLLNNWKIWKQLTKPKTPFPLNGGYTSNSPQSSVSMLMSPVLNSFNSCLMLKSYHLFTWFMWDICKDLQLRIFAQMNV